MTISAEKEPFIPALDGSGVADVLWPWVRMKLRAPLAEFEASETVFVRGVQLWASIGVRQIKDGQPNPVGTQLTVTASQLAEARPYVVDENDDPVAA